MLDLILKLFWKPQKRLIITEDTLYQKALRVEVYKKAIDIHEHVKYKKVELEEKDARILYRVIYFILSKVRKDTHFGYFKSNLFGIASFPPEQLLVKIKERYDSFEGAMNPFAVDCAVRNIIVAIRDLCPDMTTDDYNYVYGALSHLESA